MQRDTVFVGGVVCVDSGCRGGIGFYFYLFFLGVNAGWCGLVLVEALGVLGRGSDWAVATPPVRFGAETIREDVLLVPRYYRNVNTCP